MKFAVRRLVNCTYETAKIHYITDTNLCEYLIRSLTYQIPLFRSKELPATSDVVYSKDKKKGDTHTGQWRCFCT